MKSFDLKNKQALIVGAATTGLAVARFLSHRGVDVTVADMKTEKELGAVAEAVKKLDVRLALGPHRPEIFSGSDFIVVSPGVPHTMAVFNEARKNGIPVIGEIELAGRFIEEPLVAVTGTNGKTTTTRLLGEMLQAAGYDVFVGGNIGRPLIDYVDKGIHADVVVAEISSFQLDTIETFRPQVSLLLNISEDHLDRYDTFDAYVQSKARVFENQGPSDFAVLNGSDASVRVASSEIKAKALYFNSPTRNGSHAWVQADELVCLLPGKDQALFDLTDFAPTGRHNRENAAGAALAALAVGASVDGVQAALSVFPGLHHRLEHVGTHNGVRYYNDSKATNVDAVVRALQAVDAPIILIMGGRDKGGDYAPLKGLVRKKVKKLVVIGEAREKICAALDSFTVTEEAPSLEAAVAQASRAASAEDVVLLSPGCSSFDMFSDYAHRGEVFIQAVRNL